MTGPEPLKNVLNNPQPSILEEHSEILELVFKNPLDMLVNGMPIASVSSYWKFIVKAVISQDELMFHYYDPMSNEEMYSSSLYQTFSTEFGDTIEVSGEISEANYSISLSGNSGNLIDWNASKFSEVNIIDEFVGP